jgi:hypothetical protein
VDKKQKKKLKRTAKKQKEKAAAAQAQAHLKKQMNLFDKMPNACSVCQENFPKTREAHMSWRVTVRGEKQQVRLFCPACQERDKTTMEMEKQNEV